MSNLSDVCQRIYERQGQQAVLDACTGVGGIDWKFCDPCEVASPMDPDDDTCLVCGTLHKIPDDWIQASACADCVMVSANGEGASEDWDAETYGRNVAGHMVAIGDDYGFSWWSCDLCDTRLAGERFHVTLIPHRIPRPMSPTKA
jgi:hypothetical protein